jgi:hypothetical protein
MLINVNLELRARPPRNVYLQDNIAVGKVYKSLNID